MDCSKVGTTRFELATPCTPCKCATGLRYVPKSLNRLEASFWWGCKSKEKSAKLAGNCFNFFLANRLEIIGLKIAFNVSTSNHTWLQKLY